MELLIELFKELIFDYWIYLMVMANSLFIADLYGRTL